MHQEDENLSSYDGDCKNTVILIRLRLSPVQQMFAIINIAIIINIVIIIIIIDYKISG